MNTYIIYRDAFGDFTEEAPIQADESYEIGGTLCNTIDSAILVSVESYLLGDSSTCDPLDTIAEEYADQIIADWDDEFSAKIVGPADRERMLEGLDRDQIVAAVQSVIDTSTEEEEAS